MRSRAHHVPLRRTATVALSVLILIGTLGVQAREAAELHVRCAEHGLLMHVRAIGPAASAGAQTALTAPGSRESLAHDHCLFVGASHCAAHAAVAVPTVAASAPLRAPAQLVAMRFARAAYRIAPKTSPPA